MAFTHVATVTGTDATAGSTLDASSTLNIAANDVLVTVFLCHGNTGTWSVSIEDTSSNNVHTMATAAEVNDAYVHIGYVLAADANASATIRVTSNSTTDRAMVVYQFRPDSGESVSFDVESQGGSAWSATADTGNITTTGADEIVIAGITNDHSRTYSSLDIGGAAPDASTEPATGFLAMYSIYASTQSSISGSASLSSSGTWVASIISIKSEAAGGGVTIPIMMHHYAMMGR